MIIVSCNNMFYDLTIVMNDYRFYYLFSSLRATLLLHYDKYFLSSLCYQLFY